MDELIKFLKGLGLTEADAVDKIAEMAQGMVDAETEVGKGHYREKDSEAKKLRESVKGHLDSLKKMGFDSGKYDTVDEYLSARDEENSQKDLSLESLRDVVNSLKGTVSTLTGDLTSERELRTSDQVKTMNAKAHAKLAEDLAPNIYGSKGTIVGILAGNEIAMDGEDVTIGGMSVLDFSKKYMIENPDDLKSNQIGGGGNPPEQDVNNDLNNMSTLDFMGAKQ